VGSVSTHWRRFIPLPALLLAALPTFAQIPLQFRYDRWQNPDRWEGIKDRYQVSGELIEPISVLAVSGLQPAPTPQKLFAAFVLDHSSSVTLTVRMPDENYWMEPVDQQGRRVLAGRPGVNRFSWDGGVLRYLKRNTDDLKAMAVILEGAQGIAVAPVLLYDSGEAAQSLVQVDAYEFGFVPYGGRANVKYELKSPQGDILLSDRLDNRPEREPFFIPWNASAHADGEYRLNLHAVFPVRDHPAVIQDLTLTFRHRRTIAIAK